MFKSFLFLTLVFSWFVSANESELSFFHGKNIDSSKKNELIRKELKRYITSIDDKKDFKMLSMEKKSYATTLLKTNNVEIKLYESDFFIDYYPSINKVLIAMQLNHEEGNYMLFDVKSGKKISLNSVPQYSPNSKKAFVNSYDIFGAHTVNSFIIYSIANGNFLKEFDNRIKTDTNFESSYGIYEPSWKSNTVITFEKHILNEQSFKISKEKSSLMIDENNKWELVLR